MKKILLCCLAAVMFASCWDSGDDEVTNEPIPINLSSRLTAELPLNRRQDTQIANGQQVSFFVTRTGAINDVAINNARLTADGLGGFTYSYNNENNTTLYYPIYTSNVDFYAIHPYAASITLGSDYTFTINPNQSNIRNFLNSDLLYVLKSNIVKNRQTVPLVFDHKLSKANFTIRAGAGANLTGLSEVQILNVYPTTTLNTANGAISSPSGTQTNIVSYGFADETANVSATEATGISAIIVPQTVPAGEPMFRITINGVNFTYTPSAAYQFAEKTSHNFILTLVGNEITVTSSINDWLPSEDHEGTGVIE